MVLTSPLLQPSTPTKRSNPFLTAPSTSNVEMEERLELTLQSECINSLLLEFNAGLSEGCKDGTTLRSFLATKFHCKPLRISERFAGNDVPLSQVFISDSSVVIKKAKSVKKTKETVKHKKKEELDENFLSSSYDANGPLVLKLAVPTKKARRKKAQASLTRPQYVNSEVSMTSIDDLLTTVNLKDSMTSVDDLLTSTFIDDLSDFNGNGHDFIDDFKGSIHHTILEDPMNMDKEHFDFRVECSFHTQGSRCAFYYYFLKVFFFIFVIITNFLILTTI